MINFFNFGPDLNCNSVTHFLLWRFFVWILRKKEGRFANEVLNSFWLNLASNSRNKSIMLLFCICWAVIVRIFSLHSLVMFTFLWSVWLFHWSTFSSIKEENSRYINNLWCLEPVMYDKMPQLSIDCTLEFLCLDVHTCMHVCCWLVWNQTDIFCLLDLGKIEPLMNLHKKSLTYLYGTSQLWINLWICLLVVPKSKDLT